jgi:hypothetical protein
MSWQIKKKAEKKINSNKKEINAKNKKVACVFFLNKCLRSG